MLQFKINFIIYSMEREEYIGNKKPLNPSPKWFPDCLKSMLSDMYEEPTRRTQTSRNGRTLDTIMDSNMDEFERSQRGSERSKNFTKVTIREGEDFKEFRVQHSLKVKYVVVPEQCIRGNDINIVLDSPHLSLYVGNREIYPEDETMMAISDERMRYRMTGQGPCQEFQMGPSKCRFRYDEPCSSKRPQCSYSESCPYYDDGRRAILVSDYEYNPKIRERRHSQDRSVQKWNSHENFKSDETFDYEPDYYSRSYKYRYENPHEHYEHNYYPKVRRDYSLIPPTPNSTPETAFHDRNYYKSKERLSEGPYYHFREYKNERKSHSGIADQRDPADYYYRPHTYDPSTSYQRNEEPTSLYPKRKESPYRYEKSSRVKSKEDLKTLVIRDHPESMSKDSVRELVKISKRAERSPKKSKERAQTSEKPIKDEDLQREINPMKKKISKMVNSDK